jgi:hypothetical protein
MAYDHRGWQSLEKAHNAPEVAVSRDPVALPPDQEGLQAVTYRRRDDVREYRQDGLAIKGEEDGARRGGSRRRTWLWIALAVALCLIGFGVGIGAGVAIGQNSSE